MTDQGSEFDVFGDRRPRVPRTDGGGQEPTFPQVEVPTEDSYLTNIGARRYVSRFINKGEPILLNETIFCTVTMAAILLRSRRKNNRTNEMVPYFRLATEPEIEAYQAKSDTSEPDKASRTALARLARGESVEAGEASYDAEQEHRSTEALQEMRRPRRRRRRTTEEDD